MAPALHAIVPPLGFVTVHAPLDGKPPRASYIERQRWSAEAAERTLSIPGYPAGLSGAAIVARGAERSYMRRAAPRVHNALDRGQLPNTDSCWVALYWTSGAPVKQVAAAVDWKRVPTNVLGLLFVGCVVAFPHRNIDCFTIPVPRDFVGSDLLVGSHYDQTVASLVLDRAEASTGVRATLLRGETRGRSLEILSRDGREEILPFILLLDRDPVGPMFAGRSDRSHISGVDPTRP